MQMEWTVQSYEKTGEPPNDSPDFCKRILFAYNVSALQSNLVWFAI